MVEVTTAGKDTLGWIEVENPKGILGMSSAWSVSFTISVYIAYLWNLGIYKYQYVLCVSEEVTIKTYLRRKNVITSKKGRKGRGGLDIFILIKSAALSIPASICGLSHTLFTARGA